MNIWPEIHHGGKRVPCAAAAGKKEEEMIDFSVNVTPLGIPENIRSAMEESLNRAGWYPDYSKERLKRALGAFWSHPIFVWEMALPMLSTGPFSH